MVSNYKKEKKGIQKMMMKIMRIRRRCIQKQLLVGKFKCRGSKGDSERKQRITVRH